MARRTKNRKSTQGTITLKKSTYGLKPKAKRYPMPALTDSMRRAEIAVRLHHPLNYTGLATPAATVRQRSQTKPSLQTRKVPRGTTPVGTKSLQIRTKRGVQITSPHVICSDRKQRRESIFATGKTGKGANAPRTFTQKSKVRC